MGDERGSRRNYLFYMDSDGQWHSSSIADHGYSSTYTGDMLSKNRKMVSESEELNRTTWIWSGGWNSFESPVLGNFTYIAVQGKESICVVTGDKLVVNTGKKRRWMDMVVSWIRDHNMFGYDRREMRRYIGDHGDDEDLRPFAAVNVTLGAKEVRGKSGYEVSSVELHEKEAIDILMKKMENDSAFTPQKTIQTALSALQYLLNMGELEPNMVKVCVHSKSGGKWDERHLQIQEIKKHLNDVNKHRCKPLMSQSKEEIRWR